MSAWQKHTAAEFRQLLTSMGQRKVPSNVDGFDEEFEVLKAVDIRVRANQDEFYSASLGSNMCKNRYQDVLPNEGTRVVLEPTTARGDGGDYINANYVDGRRLFGVPFVYIATQAPLRSTLVDFWRMVWENNSAFIVMLCKEVEGGKNKSIRYFPDTEGGYLTCGPINVLLESENRRDETVFRRLLLRTEDGQERRVFHMQHVAWPDQSIPKSSAGLMDMIYALGKSVLSTKTPIVVHCSGGVGRTGVFIGMHVALALYQTEKPISIPRIVQYLKYCRTGMVQRKDQYLFLYYAVLREMEKIVWAFAHKGSPAALVEQQLQRAHGSVARRANTYTPSMEGQAYANGPPIAMSRSNLFPTEGSSMVLNASDHHIVRGGRPPMPSMPQPSSTSPAPPASSRAADQDERQRRELEMLIGGQMAHSRVHPEHDGDAMARGGASVRRADSYGAAAADQEERQLNADMAPRSNYPANSNNNNSGAFVQPSAGGGEGPRNPIQEQLAILQEQNQRRRGTTSGVIKGGFNYSMSDTPSRPPPKLHKAGPSSGSSILRNFPQHQPNNNSYYDEPREDHAPPPPPMPAPSNALRARYDTNPPSDPAPTQQQRPSPLFSSFSMGGGGSEAPQYTNNTPLDAAQQQKQSFQPVNAVAPTPEPEPQPKQPPAPTPAAVLPSPTEVSAAPRSNLVAKVVGSQSTAPMSLSASAPLSSNAASTSAAAPRQSGGPSPSSPGRQKYFFSPDEPDASADPSQLSGVKKRDKSLL